MPGAPKTEEPSDGATAEAESAMASTSAFVAKNINAQPFVPSRKAGGGTAPTTAVIDDLPILPDELPEDIGDLNKGFTPEEEEAEEEAAFYENQGIGMYGGEEEDLSGFGIDAALSRLTVSDTSKPPRPGHSTVSSQFMSSQLSQYLLQRQMFMFAHVPPNNPIGIPEYIHIYHSLLPLEDMVKPKVSAALGLSTKVLKGVSSNDGCPYSLWRLNDSQVPPTRDSFQEAKEIIRKWSAVANYPHLVGLRDAFLSTEFGGAALYMVYDFHPKAATLDKVYLRSSNRSPVSEDILWSFAVQLANLLVNVHSQGLALGPSLAPSKVLITNKIRIRASAIGIHSILHKDAGRSMQEQQSEDVVRVGQLLLLMACKAGSGSPSMETVERHYSKLFVQLLQNILSPQKGLLPNSNHLCHMLSQYAFTELSKMNTLNDMLYENLYKELQNGRLLKLLVKLGMVNERPDDVTMHWADSGDRYLLKLFRDFVFHQKSEDGRPDLDWGHVFESLNKLDAGVGEPMMLVSRDEKSVLVVSYKDIKQAVTSAYGELQSKAAPKSR